MEEREVGDAAEIVERAEDILEAALVEEPPRFFRFRVRLTELDSVEDSELSGVFFLRGEDVAADFVLVVLRVVAVEYAVDVAVVGHGDSAQPRRYRGFCHRVDFSRGGFVSVEGIARVGVEIVIFQAICAVCDIFFVFRGQYDTSGETFAPRGDFCPRNSLLYILAQNFEISK